jgi:O-antigen/teichoic acid export membrane protein
LEALINFLLKAKLKVKILLDDKRIKNLLLSSVASFGTKLINSLVSFISLPLTYKYLSSERFGLMTFIVAIGSTFVFMDFGLGFGLQNRWPEFSEHESKIRKAISSVFYFLVAMAMLLAMIGSYIFYFVDIHHFFSISETAISLYYEAKKVCLIFIFLLALSFPFTVVQKIQTGSQNGHITSMWIGLGNLTSLITLLIITNLNLGLEFIVFALYGVNSLFIIINFLNEFFIKKSYNLPSLKYFDFSLINLLIKDGVIYLVHQLSSTALIVSSSFLLGKYKGNIEVGAYNIGLRLSTLFLIPVESIAPYFLPALNEAFVKKDFDWIHTKLKGYLKVLIFYSLAILIIMALAGDFILEIWMRSRNILKSGEIISFAFLSASTVFIFFSSYVMLTPTLIKKSLLIYPISVITTFTLKFLWVKQFSIIGINYAQVIGMLLIYFSLSMYYLKKYNYL